MAILKLHSLRKQFAPNVIPVKDISLTVDDGEFLTLLGPSGCGKSTLLRLIAGLEEPTSGEVIVGENNLTRTPPGDRNMAMVFQSYALYPHMTVAENIATSLKIRKTPKEEIQQRVGAVTDTLGLSHLGDRKPGQLSGGQRQRVALARALVRKPEVFLLDEPLSNLDALLREQVREELKQLFEAQQKPVVYVTHDQTEAMTLSSKVAILLDGLVQQLDPPGRIYTHPANKFVAGFVGSPQMNLLSLECKGDRAILGDFSIPLPSFSVFPSAIDMGIRPEDLSIATEEDKITVEGNVFLVENFGRELLASVKVNGSKDTLRILVSPDREWGKEAIKLAFNRDRIHWFDAKTGDRH
ncbi:ABC transporter ATP-binding protein [Spirulina sp. 06S082]|uniref:ABC transporter ATP-binding protein n=1 Tax=Spirulina sp. 06S082 TaxID=3110248 RepID=UPI002B1F6768|nr:ABC transporter ATP-binding protein [Spirulina sp. 06S082]MEA5468044.1 ABC transporter ATP-binding protein [Spirulina sp. 06S082]